MGRDFDLKNYEEVKDRIPRFLAAYPEGRIITQLVSEIADLTTVIFEAILYRDAEEQARDLPLATGWAFEKEGAGMVNKTSHLENCETSAIGRALANIGLHGTMRPSAEEMRKVQQAQPQAQPQAQQAQPAQQIERPAARARGMSTQELDAKRRAFFANAKKLGYSAEEAHDKAKEQHDAESFNDLTYEQLKATLSTLQRGARAHYLAIAKGLKVTKADAEDLAVQVAANNGVECDALGAVPTTLLGSVIESLLEGKAA